jgi:hypothetical protein
MIGTDSLSFDRTKPDSHSYHILLHNLILAIFSPDTLFVYYRSAAYFSPLS